ncbi:hypothetical protein CMEL01_15701 [Colletotrichum melonis]|uniref:C2H2-type domain-containing protein n=1 Tax=Colletotrichum melonis TaxID=1209925 RepID=A0AAI9XRM0_9PEZI|nr:hypothetical protein CMEL01_15701 [Colletotrichum melonis]
MRPPPPNKGKAPLTDDGGLSDSSSQPSDAEVISYRSQAGDETPNPTVSAQPSSRGSLWATQEMHGDKSIKLGQLSPGLERGSGTDSAAADAEFSHSETGQKSSSPPDLTMKKKKKKVKETGADGPDAVYAAALGEDAKNLSFHADQKFKSEFAQDESTVQLGRPPGHPSLERSSAMSEGETEGSASNVEDEPQNQNEDRIKKVQRLIVDRVMSSFMSWLDIKKHVKQEEEEEHESASQFEESASQFEEDLFGAAPGGDAADDALSKSSSMMLGSVPSSAKSSSRGHELESFMFRQVPALSAPAPVTRHRNSNISLPPPPPPRAAFGELAPFGMPPLPAGRESQISATYVPSADSMVDFAGIPPLASAAQAPVPGLIPPQQVQSRSGYIVSSGINKRRMRSRVNKKISPLLKKHYRSTDGQTPGEGEEEGDEDELPRAKLSKVQEDTIEGAKLACPFFKYNPRKYKTQRPCCGPGWDQVHRIKEHIYRKHSLPKFSCPRCSQSFETQLALQAHARSLDACDVREPEVLDGITQDQEKKLRSRKKTSVKELTEAEKWIQVYRILFPDVREREIPSPYHNAEDAEKNLGGYEDYLRRELPPLVRRQLEKEVERELSFVEEGMKQKVIDIARNLQLTLFKGYQQLENQERGLQEALSVDASSSSEMAASFFTATDASPSTMTTGGTTPEIPDPLDIFGDPAIPDFDFGFLADIPYPESQSPSKGQNLGLEFNQSFATQEPATITPGMELLGAQQHDLPYYGLEGYQDPNSQRIDASVLSYLP